MISFLDLRHRFSTLALGGSRYWLPQRGAGAILGGLWLGHRSQSVDLVTVAVLATLGGAAAAICVSATSSLWIAMPCIGAFGFCLSSAGIAIQTMIQLSSERSMRGRVMGVYGLIFRGAPAIGALAAGSASVHFGLRWPVIAGAAIVIAVAIWTYNRQAEISAALPNLDPNP